jgi:hypothetical protein
MCWTSVAARRMDKPYRWTLGTVFRVFTHLALNVMTMEALPPPGKRDGFFLARLPHCAAVVAET